MPDGKSLLVLGNDLTRVSAWIQPIGGRPHPLDMGEVVLKQAQFLRGFVSTPGKLRYAAARTLGMLPMEENGDIEFGDPESAKAFQAKMRANMQRPVGQIPPGLKFDEDVIASLIMPPKCIEGYRAVFMV